LLGCVVEGLQRFGPGVPHPLSCSTGIMTASSECHTPGHWQYHVFHELLQLNLLQHHLLEPQQTCLGVNLPSMNSSELPLSSESQSLSAPAMTSINLLIDLDDVCN
jgi:hypothetical protein